jgi:hypothetical protein
MSLGLGNLSGAAIFPPRIGMNLESEIVSKTLTILGMNVDLFAKRFGLFQDRHIS